MEVKFVKVQEHEHLIKDISSGAILNVDKSAIVRHEKRIREIEKEKRRDDDLNNLKSELSEIKALLKALIEQG